MEDQLTDREYIDLATEAGDIIDLVSKGKENGKRYLEARMTFILIKVVLGTIAMWMAWFDIEDDREDAQPQYIPLADVSEKVKLACIDSF